MTGHEALVVIWIDNRLGSRDLIRYAPLDTPDACELTRLDSGDVAFAGIGPHGPLLVGVEVKTLSDLIASLASGRLQATQVCDAETGMLASYDVRWLLYWGTYRCGEGGELEVPAGRAPRDGGRMPWRPYTMGSSRRQFRYSYLEDRLIDLCEVGVHVKHVYDIEQGARWLWVLYRQWQKEFADRKSFQTFDNSRGIGLVPGMDRKTRMRATVAAALPGVEFTRAVAAAAHFASIKAMVNASAREWAEVDGIGKVIARAVTEAVE